MMSRSSFISLPVLLALAPGALARADEDGDGLYTALRRAPSTPVVVGGGRIDVAFAGEAPGLDRKLVLDWIRMSAEAITAYFGRFSVERVGLLVSADDGDRIHTGTTFGYAGSAMRITVGRRADAATFKRDWILVHEMTHLALPTVPRRSLWFAEGNATYVEPIARAQAGQLDPAVVWMWAAKGLPQGQVGASAGGLDGSGDHDRIYWGGFLYWLLADIGVRERTGGRIGVQTALQAINRASGGNAADWTIEQAAATGDAATGGREMRDLYARMGRGTYPIDVGALLTRLGVQATGGRLTFDDAAPLAAVRRAITRKA